MSVVTYQGKSVPKWACEIGIAPASLRKRVEKYGWAVAVTIPPKRQTNPKTYRYGNEDLSLVAWVSRLSCSYSWFWSQVRDVGFERAMARSIHRGYQPKKTTMKECKAKLEEVNGPSQHYHPKRFGCLPYKDAFLPIVEVKETVEIGAKANLKMMPKMGIAKEVGYVEDLGAGRLPAAKLHSRVIKRGLELGKIICAETGKAAVELICRGCPVAECPVSP